jgi:hypothetical protein
MSALQSPAAINLINGENGSCGWVGRSGVIRHPEDVDDLASQTSLLSCAVLKAVHGNTSFAAD